jgi:hypothetical protein
MAASTLWIKSYGSRQCPQLAEADVPSNTGARAWGGAGLFVGKARGARAPPFLFAAAKINAGFEASKSICASPAWSRRIKAAVTRCRLLLRIPVG